MRYPILLIVLALLALTGCRHAGLSDREGGEQTFANYVLTLYDTPTAPAGPTVLRLPARLAVAQVGELAPPAELLEYLRSQNRYFTAADPVPGVFEAPRYYDYSGQNHTDPAAARAAHCLALRQGIERLANMARGTGADYLFVCGGDVDYGSQSNPLAVLDWTIIGAYLVPGKTVRGQARAGGVLVDLANNQPAVLVSADSQRSGLSTWAGQSGAERRMLERVRQEALTALAENLVARLDGARR
jgi:rhombotail lipoprotein